MRETSSFSAKTRCGRRTFRFVSGGCCTVDLHLTTQRALPVLAEIIAQNSFTTVKRVLETHKLSFESCELIGREEGLGKKPFQSTGEGDHLAVLRRQLLKTEHRNDVLEFCVLSEGSSYFLCEGVVSFADDARRGHFGAGLQRIDGRIEAFARPLSREHDRCREMGKRVHRRRISRIVGRDIDGLD